jgi:hypothetical protein
VNVEAEVPVGPGGRLRRAGMDADSHLERSFGQGQLLLDRGGRRDCTCGLGEGHEELVALAVDLDALCALDLRPNKVSELGQNGRVAVAKLSDKPRRPFDVGEEEGDGPTGKIAHGPL